MPIIPPTVPSTTDAPPAPTTPPSLQPQSFQPQPYSTQSIPQSTPFTQPATPPVFTPPPSKPNRLPLLIFLFLLVVVVLGAVGYFVFGNRLRSNQSGKDVTLTYWGLWEPENVIQSIISEYQSSHPNVKITYLRQSQKDYRERLQSSLSGPQGPDIFRFHNSWVPMFQNFLSPVPSTIMDNSTFDQTYYPVAQKDLKLKGKYVGIPLEIDTLLLYYNEDLLRTGGKTPPTTWDELLTTAQDLTIREGEKIVVSGAALGNATNVDHWPDILSLLMLQNGADMTKPGSTLGSDGRNLGVDALTFYTLFTKTYRIWDTTFPSSTAAFAAGKVALYFGPSWEAFEFAKNPSLHFKAIPTPRLADVETYYATYWADGVSAKSAHTKEAWEFLKFLSEKENMQKFYDSQAKTRLFGEPPSRTDMAAQFADTPFVSAVLKSAPLAVSSYTASATWDGQTGLNSRLITYLADAVNAVNQTTKPEEALKTVDQGFAQVLSQYLSR